MAAIAAHTVINGIVSICTAGFATFPEHQNTSRIIGRSLSGGNEADEIKFSQIGQ
ncbi:hypothetical protein [Methanosarcina siciliae]|uniref:hypothetical protein n=1 Tax=Methanosarcina siciliae TaxID=38027 RepID=UPI0012E00D28|nr:hypothetical protein [Methanosarcina siciliae]